MADATRAAGRSVLWTIVPTATQPEPVHRYCPGCRERRPFASSGRFRVNAQRRRLDVWLVYRCASCDRTWNRTVHERVTPDEIGPSRLAGFHANDPDLAAGIAAASLPGGAPAGTAARRDGGPVGTAATRDGAPAFRVDGPGLRVAADPAAGDRVEVRLALAAPCRVRLDVLLAAALGASRADVVRLVAGGRVVVPGGVRRLARPARDGDVLSVSARLSDVAANGGGARDSR